MSLITQSDLKKLSACAKDLMASADEAELRQKVVFKWLPAFIPSDWISCNEFYKGERLSIIMDRDMALLATYGEAFNQYIHEHPCYQLGEGGISMPLKISDFLTQEQFHKLTLYQEVYRHIGVEYQMSTSTQPVPGYLVGLALSRTHKDYDERERVLLSLMQPGLEKSFREMRRRAELKSLSARELEVFDWVGKAKTNKEIGQILGISPRTVQKHLESVFEKLGIESRTGAALWMKSMKPSA
ncbi:MAG: response regulator transcription factor [Verrucomicrobium sp.]